MNVDFKTTVWERIQIPEEFKEEAMAKMNYN